MNKSAAMIPPDGRETRSPSLGLRRMSSQEKERTSPESAKRGPKKRRRAERAGSRALRE